MYSIQENCSLEINNREDYNENIEEIFKQSKMRIFEDISTKTINTNSINEDDEEEMIEL